ncbi:hypothetical protein BT69DRAFT_1338117 [Atractiella rhizophila]|nr:hypothetical protein BT69DRAFT_1338117 [Atractiella rhizophila]
MQTTPSTHNFETDPVFQSGISSILTATTSLSPSEKDELIARAKAFYLQQLQTQPTESVEGTITDAPETEEPEKLSFARLVQMIERGEPIPGIKEIPDRLSDEKPSKSTAEVRRKPWEKEGGTAQALQLASTEDLNRADGRLQ